jgi:hypothetical protein
MKMNYWVVLAVVGGIFSQPVLAISEACTQVDEANGTCHVGHTRHHPRDDESTGDIAREIDSNIAGKYQGEAVDYMEDAGWHSTNGERTRWRKNGYTAEFDMTSSGKLEGVSVR